MNDSTRHRLRIATVGPLALVFTVPLAGLSALLSASRCLAGSLLLVGWIFRHLNRVEEELGRTNQRLKDRTAELAALSSIGREISYSSNLAEVCSTVTRYCRDLVPSGIFFLAMANPEKREVSAGYVDKNEELKVGERLPVGPGFVEWVLRTLRPLLIRDILVEGPNLPFPTVTHDPAIRSILMVPLIVDQKGPASWG